MPKRSGKTPAFQGSKRDAPTAYPQVPGPQLSITAAFSPSERNVLRAVVQALELCGIVFITNLRGPFSPWQIALQLIQDGSARGAAWRVNVGGQLSATTTMNPCFAAGVRRRFIRYGVAGMSDIVGILAGGRLLAIEVKRLGCRTTKEQSSFLAVVQQLGGLAFVASDPEDVFAQLPPPQRNTKESNP